MLYAILILIALTAFCCGFWLGNNFTPARPVCKREQKPKSFVLTDEYKNFLKYNGEEMPSKE